MIKSLMLFDYCQFLILLEFVEPGEESLMTTACGVMSICRCINLT